MKYPIIYDKFETNFERLGLAILENANNVKIKEVINGEYLLSLILPRNDPKWKYVNPANFICVDGQKFRIRTFEEQRDSSGKLLSNIQCEHVYYDANDCRHMPYVELIGVTPRQVLETAFQSTKFTIGTVEITTLTDIFLSKCNPAQVVNQLIDNVGGELVKDNWTIHLLHRRGFDNGIQFRVGKNITSIKKQTDDSSVVTRLYPYGADDLDIYTVNEGKTYIDSPLINNYDYPRTGTKEYKDIKDPFPLLQEAWKEFSTETYDGIDKPKVTYSCEIIELKKLKSYGDIEKFSLGDSAKIIDESLNVATNQYVVDYEYYPYEPIKSRVVLINYSSRFYRDRQLGKMLTNFLETSKTLNYLLTEKGDINSSFLDNIRSKLSTYINAQKKNIILHDHGDCWVDNLENPTRAMAIISGMFAIANSKKENGDWDWKSFGDGDGFIADLLIAGKLIGGKVQFNLDEGKFLIGDSESDYMLYYDGSKLLLNTEQMSSMVVKNGVISAINQSAESIKIAAEKINISGNSIDLSGNTTVRTLNGNTYSFDGNNFTLKNSNNVTTLSADGIVQTDNLLFADSADINNPLSFIIYIDDNVANGGIRNAVIRFNRQPFRAYSKGVIGGATGGDINTSYELPLNSESGPVMGSLVDEVGEHLQKHSHFFNWNHSHPTTIQYGIYSSGMCNQVYIGLDGVDLGYSPGFPAVFDLAPWLTKGWHTISIKVDANTRLSGSLFLKTFHNGN